MLHQPREVLALISAPINETYRSRSESSPTNGDIISQVVSTFSAAISSLGLPGLSDRIEILEKNGRPGLLAVTLSTLRFPVAPGRKIG